MTGGPTREDLTKLRDLYSPDMDIDSFESQMSSSDVFKRKALRFAQQNDQELFDAIINPNKKKVVSAPQEDGLESSTEGSPSVTGSSQEGDEVIKPWQGSFEPEEPQVDQRSEALRDVNSALQFGFIPPSVERLKQEKESDQLDRRLQLGVAAPSQQREYNEEMKAASDKRRSKIEAGLRESYNSDFSVVSNPDGVSMEYKYSYKNIDGKEVFNRVVPLSIDKDQSADQLYTFLGPKLQEIIALETYGYNDRIDSDPGFKEQQQQLLDLIGKEITFTSDESSFVTAGGGAGAGTVVERREYTREDYFEDINELREKKRGELYSEWSQGIKSQILEAFPGLTEEELKSIDTSLYTEYGVDLDLDNDGMYNVKSWGEDAMTSLEMGLNNVSYSLGYIPTYLKSEFAKLVSGYDEDVVKIADERKAAARRNKRVTTNNLDARRTKFTKDLSEAFESGDAELFGRQLLNTTAETAPIILETTAVTVLSGGTAAPYLAAGLIGTQTGIGTYMDIADDPELSEGAKLGIAITSGAAEGAFAFVGGKITSKAMMNQIARDAVDGDAIAKNRLRDFVKGQLITNGLEPMLAEGSEEFMVEFTNSIAEDIAYGRDVDFDAALSRGKTAFIAGAGAGKAFNTAGSVSGRVMGAVNSRFTSADLSIQLGIDAEIESAINSIQGVKDPELITVMSNRVARLQELKNESRGEQRAYFEAMMVRQPEAFNDLMDANTRVSVLTEAYAKADESSKELISKEIDAEMARIEGAHAMMSDTSSELTIDERNQLADMRVSSIRDGASRMQSVAEARLRQLKDDGAGAHEVSKAQAEVKAISESVSALTELQEKSRLADGYLSEVMAAHEAGIMTDEELQLAVDQSNYFNKLISDVTGTDIESISRTVEVPAQETEESIVEDKDSNAKEEADVQVKPVKPTNPLSSIDEAGFISPTMREAIYRLTPKGMRGMLPRPTMDADPLSFKEKSANLKDRARREFRKFFYSGGGLDTKSSEIIRGRDRSRRAFENTIKSEVQVLNRLLKKAGYDDQASIDLIQGAIDGTIVDERLTGVSEADARAELRSKLISQFGEKDGSIIFYMRDRIDSMTDDVIFILETVKGNEDLVQRMRENKGSYLNRSYKVFSDEAHRDRLSKPRGKRDVNTQHLFDDAIDYVMEENPGMSFDEAQGIVEQYVQDVVGKGHRGMVMSGSRVYTSNTKGRKEIAEPFRKLLGEIKDPVLQYTQTVLKLNEMKTSLEMQQELANHLIEAGLGSESITEDMNTPLTDSKTDSFGMEPLNAINVDPDFREAYESLDPLKSMQDYDLAIRNFIRFQSNVKMYKTVLSPTTTFRNFMSGMFLSANAGHQPFSSHTALAFKEAWGGRKTREELRVITRKLIESGIIGDGGRSGEMLATINDAGHDISNITGDAGPGTKLFNVAQKLYAFGDDFYKVNGFMLEKDRLIKEGGMTEEQAWDIAAERIRGGYPTYSYLPKNMQALRRFPLTGTFVSFPYEVMRTTKNNLRYMLEDFQAGRKKMGMRRLAGLFIATTGPSIVSALSMGIRGIDDEEEAMLRRAKAPWERNSQLLVLSNEDGAVTTLDLSFLAPSATWLKPFTALARSRTGLKGDDTAFDRAWDGVKELLDPYTSVDLSFATFSRLVNNKDEFGNPIYNGTPFNEDSGKAMKDMLGEADKVSVWLGKKVGPGAFNNFAEFMRANSVREDLFGSRVTKYKEYTNQEALLALFGFRTSAMPIPNSVRYTMHDVDAAIDNQKRFMTKAVDGEDPDYNEIVDQIQDWVLLNEERSATAKVMFERGTSLMTKSGAPRADKTLLSVFDKSDREYLEKGELIPIPLPYSREESSAKSTLNVRLSGLWLEQLNKFQAEMEEAPAMTTNNINNFIGLIRSDYPELFNSINNKYVRRRIANEVVQQYIDTGEFNWVEDEEAIRADIEKKTVDVFRDVLRDYAKPTKSR